MILKRRERADGRGPGRRRGWTGALAAASALAVVASVVTSVATPREARAARLDQHTPMTYNMQGASDGQLAKWTNTVRTQAKTHDVIALQEAGSRPHMGVPETAANQHGMRVDRYLWRVDTVDGDPLRLSGVRNVYFMETDPNGHRVNLAIVTPHAADEVIVIPPAFPGSRAAFGIRIGTTVFFTMHGLSGGGNDDRRLLEQMDQTVTGPNCWAALGDYNREPDQWNRSGSRPGDAGHRSNRPTLPGTSRIYGPNEPTHVISSGVERELDYMVTNCNIPDTWGGNRIGDLSSDHVPVEFRALALNTTGRKKALVTKKDGQGLDQLQVSRLGRNRAVVKPRSAAASQRYSLRPAGGGRTRIVNEAGECLNEVNTPIGFQPNLHTQTFWDPCYLPGATDQWRLNFSTIHSGYFSLLNEGTRRCLTLNGDYLAGRECAGGGNEEQLFAMAPTLAGSPSDAGEQNPSAPGQDPTDTGDGGNPSGGTEAGDGADVTWALAGPSGEQAARNYDTMINALRRAAGAHPFRGQVGQTTPDTERLVPLRVELAQAQGRPSSLTLYLTAHDTRLRGWAVGDRLYQFNDWHLGRRLGRQVTTLPFASDEASLRRVWLRTGGRPGPAENVQRLLNAGRITGALNDLARETNDHTAANAGLVVSTVITQAAHFGAVSHVSTQALGDSDPKRDHTVNDTMYGLFDDWEALSRFTRNITRDPNHTPPLDLQNPDITVRTFNEAANFVILIS